MGSVPPLLAALGLAGALADTRIVAPQFLYFATTAATRALGLHTANDEVMLVAIRTMRVFKQRLGSIRSQVSCLEAGSVCGEGVSAEWCEERGERGEEGLVWYIAGVRVG